MRSHSSGVSPEPGVGDFDDHLSVIAPGSQRERAAIRHGIHRIEHQIRQRAVQQVGIGSDGPRFSSNSNLHSIGARPGACSCAW